MNDQTQKSQAFPVRGGKNGETNSSDDKDGVQGTRTASTSLRNDLAGFSGTGWEKINPFVLAEFSERVLQRLVWQAENRLSETIECIEWYEREKLKLEAELRELKSIGELRKKLEIESVTFTEEE